MFSINSTTMKHNERTSESNNAFLLVCGRPWTKIDSLFEGL